MYALRMSDVNKEATYLLTYNQSTPERPKDNSGLYPNVQVGVADPSDVQTSMLN